MSDIHTELTTRAERVMPAGVNSPVRAFRSVGGDPIFASHAEGATLTTQDGRTLIDYCMSFGPLVLGHAHPRVIEAVTKAARAGTSFAVTTEPEIRLAEKIQDAIPSMELMRLVSSGTEACMTAIRLARGATGRTKILKFSGCYHGHADCLLVQAGSGVAGIAEASSSGVPSDCARQMLVSPYNDLESVRRVVAEHGSELAAIIVEPVAANMGLILPADGFLQGLREICTDCGAALIFDEVISGFRYTYGAYQSLCHITPDLTCLGKAIGGGMPIGAVGGRREIMECIAPLGSVYQGGTLSGNPVSVAGGLATLETLHELNPYPVLEQRTRTLAEHLRAESENHGIELSVPRLGSLFSLFFSPNCPTHFDDVQATDTDAFLPFFKACLERGLYLAPSPYEAGFVSLAHQDNIIEQSMDIFSQACKAVSCKS